MEKKLKSFPHFGSPFHEWFKPDILPQNYYFESKKREHSRKKNIIFATVYQADGKCHCSVACHFSYWTTQGLSRLELPDYKNL